MRACARAASSATAEASAGVSAATRPAETKRTVFAPGDRVSERSTTLRPPSDDTAWALSKAGETSSAPLPRSGCGGGGGAAGGSSGGFSPARASCCGAVVCAADCAADGLTAPPPAGGRVSAAASMDCASAPAILSGLMAASVCRVAVRSKSIVAPRRSGSGTTATWSATPTAASHASTVARARDSSPGPKLNWSRTTTNARADSVIGSVSPGAVVVTDEASAAAPGPR